MTQGHLREPQARKIENARDLQAKLYREIGISAVAAALRFTKRPDDLSQPASEAPLEAPRARTIAA